MEQPGQTQCYVMCLIVDRFGSTCVERFKCSKFLKTPQSNQPHASHASAASVNAFISIFIDVLYSLVTLVAAHLKQHIFNHQRPFAPFYYNRLFEERLLIAVDRNIRHSWLRALRVKKIPLV